MVCLRNMCMDTLHKGDNDDDDNNNNNTYYCCYLSVQTVWQAEVAQLG